MNALAAALAVAARRGDVVALHGDLGTGKTTFARAFIRARGRGDEEVPSPTFTLVQMYDGRSETDAATHHFDVFRLSHPQEAIELGLEESFLDAVTLIEWPERLGSSLPDARLDVFIEFGATPEQRIVRLQPRDDRHRRLAAGDHD